MRGLYFPEIIEVSKRERLFVGDKTAPAGAPSPSTVLLRGILSVYKTEISYAVSLKDKNSYLVLFELIEI